MNSPPLSPTRTSFFSRRSRKILLLVLLNLAIFPLSVHSVNRFLDPTSHLGILTDPSYKGHPPTLSVGAMATDFSLTKAGGEEQVALTDHYGAKPVVLIFGSYSCPYLREKMPTINDLYAKHKDQVEFIMVYTREAHPAEDAVDENIAADVNVTQPSTLAERATIAQRCVDALDIEFPVLVDDMNDSVMESYQAFPVRTCLVRPDGIVGYRSEQGPLYFDMDELAAALESLPTMSYPTM